MYRSIERDLKDWKKSSRRKPLLFRGARQIGKTLSVRKLGSTYPHFLEANFEELRDRSIAH